MTITELPLPLRHRLPRIVTPFPDETRDSYEIRLATANGISWTHLREHATGSTTRHLNLTQMAAVTGLPERTLLLALPELRDPSDQHPGLPLAGRTEVSNIVLPRPACRRCAAARGITVEVTRWTRHDENVCLKHKLWIGRPVRKTDEQSDVAGLPDVINAQRWHRNLIRRHGHALVRYAFEDAAWITRRWVSRGFWNGSWLPRVQKLLGPQYVGIRENDPIADLVAYPHTVGLTSMFVSPFWHSVAGLLAREPRSVYDDIFLGQVARITGITGIKFFGARDPLLSWCTRDRGTSADSWWKMAIIRSEVCATDEASQHTDRGTGNDGL